MEAKSLLLSMVCCFGRFRKRKIRHHNMAEKSETLETVPETEEKYTKEEATFDILNAHVLQYLSKYIGHEWEHLALNLGLTREDVSKACIGHTRNHTTRVKQVLLTWHEKHQNDQKRLPSLMRALETCGRKDLAQKLHCAQWSEQEFKNFDMPSSFPMLIIVDKNREKPKQIAFPKVNDLNPSTGPPVHSKSPRFIISSG